MAYRAIVVGNLKASADVGPHTESALLSTVQTSAKGCTRSERRLF